MVLSEQSDRLGAPALLDENVQSHQLSDEHVAMQFIGRLGWAILDAEDADGARSSGERLERPAPRRAQGRRSSSRLRLPRRQSPMRVALLLPRRDA
jgi:hypothetical protein